MQIFTDEQLLSGIQAYRTEAGDKYGPLSLVNLVNFLDRLYGSTMSRHGLFERLERLLLRGLLSRECHSDAKSWLPTMQLTVQGRELIHDNGDMESS